MPNDYYALEVHDLTVAYGAKPVLWDIDLGIPKGRLAAIIGPNGAGKTTLIKAMVGLIKPVSGGVDFHDVEIKNGRFKNKIAYVPQSGSVDWDFPATVLDVVMMGRYGHLGWFKRPGKRDKRMALETLESVGMREYASRQISQLSGGQQQRVFLARALIQQAEIYFMDEPFKGVDAQTEKTIVELLKKLKEQGKTVILVHHDLQTVSDYFDWVTLINLRIVANGPVEEVFTERYLSLAYVNRGLTEPGKEVS
ncbi:MAG: metal ABC transporter ATP-binding protein [Oscillospiraceae bacterium]|nr:metal ABC transporter ATP-binding protein [Oscillospiraceae bacterium]